MGLFDVFTGSDARQKAKSAGRAGNRAYRLARGDVNQAYDSAQGRMDAYDDGGQAYTAYQDLLGLNGAGAQSTAQGMIFNDPAYQQIADQQTNALMRRYNAMGGRISGAAMQGANRLGLENYENRLTRFANLGNQGLGIAQTRAGMDVNRGDTMANLRIGQGNHQIGTYSALAQANQMGANNLMNLAGAALKAYGGS